jgi:hypothetical protein
LDDPLTERLKQFIAILEIVRIEDHVVVCPRSMCQQEPWSRPCFSSHQ